MRAALVINTVFGVSAKPRPSIAGLTSGAVPACHVAPHSAMMPGEGDPYRVVKKATIRSGYKLDAPKVRTQDCGLRRGGGFRRLPHI